VSTVEIAEAALAIGLDRATVRNVADRLGMSVPGLYHHVRTRDELLAIAATHAVGTLELPPDEGQPWAEWLLDFASFVYERLIVHPEVVGRILTGTGDTVRQTQQLERFLDVLTGRGFSLIDAFETYLNVLVAVTGAASAHVSRRASAEAGHPLADEFARNANLFGSEAAPLVRKLVQALGPSDRARRLEIFDPFETVRLVIASITVESESKSSSKNGRRPARR
jgi:AcrR family transcriptional regulator